MVNLAEEPRARVARTLRTWVCAGAPIPRVLVEAATKRLGAKILSGWGMTENGALTVTRPDDPPEKVFDTDGLPLHGHEIRIVDAEGRPLPPGAEGELQARGPGSFVGYLKRPQLFGTDAEGWFGTGDLARMDEDGYVRIVGRSKDIIIRGGENIPVVEIEGLLYRHPAVQDAAIVAMPHERLGEQGCAFVTPKPGRALSMEDVKAWLEKHGVAKNYWPERLEVVEAMPRTPSGKIQKFKLRETARALGSA
jgi:cyclohexanecarboxylate-CoA ligase